MTQWKLLGSTAVLAAMAGNAAWAITPEEVWAKWKNLSATNGQTLTTGGEAREGDALVITDMTLTHTKDGSAMTMTVPEVRLEDVGGGKVEITLTDSYDLIVTPETEKPDSTVVVNIAHPGMKTVASGSVEESVYDFEAPEIAVKVKEVVGGAENEKFSAAAGVSNAKGSYILAGDALTSATTADALTVSVSGEAEEGAEEPGSFKLDMSATNIAGQSNAMLKGSAEDMAKAVQEGFATDGTLTFGTSTFTADVSDATGNVVIAGGGDSGSFNANVSKDGIGYGSAIRNVSITASGSHIPFPELKVSYAEGAFDFLMPVVKSEEPSDFRFVTRLLDLSISDEVWAMFDPTGQLPRDPASVVIDTAGKARLTTDIFDATVIEKTEAMPGELNALTLKQLLVKFAGAEVTGTGDLTFDNGDLETYGGVPAPEGTINLKATGINGLLDKLTAMGLVPEEDLMGLRMMMGMFVKMDPSAPDTMTSDLEFKDKHFSVNGMQLQ